MTPLDAGAFESLGAAAAMSVSAWMIRSGLPFINQEIGRDAFQATQVSPAEGSHSIYCIALISQQHPKFNC